MAKRATGPTRKSRAKKANAPMKNAPKEKPPGARAKADAKKAARGMAKLVQPGIRKSAAKRVEKEEKRVARPSLAALFARDGFPAVKKQANKLIAVLKNDSAAVAAGEGDETRFRELVLAVSRAVASTKKKQGVHFE